MKNKYEYDSPIFYGGEQCRRFFVREIVKPIESTSYNIRRFYGKSVPKTYCEDTSDRMLADRAIANYKKSIAEYKNLSDKDEKNFRTDRLFQSFHHFTMTTVLCLMLVEFASILFTGLASILACICYAIFDVSNSLNPD